MIYWSLFLNVLVFVATEAQTVGRGSCPITQVQQNFDVTRYLGKWYEIEKMPNLFQRGVCTEANYGPVNQLGQVGVLNKEVSNNRVVAVEGIAVQDGVNNDGDLKVTLRVPIVGQQSSDYKVLATDYDNYAAVYACTEIIPRVLKVEFGWILSRARQLAPQHMAQVNYAILSNGVDRASFKRTNQNNCPNLDLLPYQKIA